MESDFTNFRQTGSELMWHLGGNGHQASGPYSAGTSWEQSIEWECLNRADNLAIRATEVSVAEW